MKILYILYFFLHIATVDLFKNIYYLNKNSHALNKKYLLKTNFKYYKNNDYANSDNVNNNDKNNTIIVKNKDITNFKEKINNYLKLIRCNNIIPTTLLCFSGGWIINPSFYNLLYSRSFIVSTIDTVLIMSASMVINDIHDLEIDKVNSPDRPLANGSIKSIEALIFALLLIGTSEYLTLSYLNDSLKLIIQLVIINITIYTPILKRNLIIKNISCASLVSFSLFFTALSSSNTLLTTNKNFGLLSLAMSILFFGSWSNEMLLDMRDIDGDKKNDIITFPVIFGKEKSWVLTNIILYFGIISNTLSIAYLYDNSKVASIIIVILSPLLINLYNIKNKNYSNESIIKYMKYSNYPLIMLLIYLCILAKF